MASVYGEGRTSGRVIGNLRRSPAEGRGSRGDFECIGRGKIAHWYLDEPATSAHRLLSRSQPTNTRPRAWSWTSVASVGAEIWRGPTRGGVPDVSTGPVGTASPMLKGNDSF